MEFFDVVSLFNLAESVYSIMRGNGIFISEPDTFRLPLQLPRHNATAFAVVSNGNIKELEIHYDTGQIETIRSPNF
jgi:hypothetical protein